MPLVQEDLRQIKGLVETLIAERIAASVLADRESPKESSEIKNIHIELKNQRDLIEKILHQMDKRFEQVDKRFEDTNRRFEEQREDMNRRFEQVDKRFEEMRQDMNKRFQQLFWFIGLFIPLCNSLLFIAMN